MTKTSSAIPSGSTIGIIGGGQLARMAALAAARFGYKCHIYCDVPDSPAFDVSDKYTLASYDNVEALTEFANKVSVVTIEFENIPYESARKIESLINLRPGCHVLKISQDRLLEKQTISDLGIPVAPYAPVSSLADLESAIEKIGRPAILKTTRFGYDGKGQVLIDEASDLSDAYSAMRGADAILEGFVNFEREISVIVARSKNGECKAFEPVENVHVNHILDTTIAPANINEKVRDKATDIAMKLVHGLDVTGLLAVEMFHTKDDQIIVNEIAPRPHNSGHWSMDGCMTDQFEQLVRAITGQPLGSTKRTADTIMKNLIGEDVDGWESFLKEPNAKIHLYGKQEVRKGRKMGHINYIYELGNLPKTRQT